MRTRDCALIVAATAGAIAAPGWTAEPTEAAARALAPLAACSRIAAPGDRTACYDRAYAQLQAAVAAGEVVIGDAVQRRADFGFSAPPPPPRVKPAKADRAAKAVPSVPATVESTVAAVRDAGSGQTLVTLADGATWQTTDADGRFFAKVGDKVRLSRGMLSSYFIEIVGRSAARAKRVR